MPRHEVVHQQRGTGRGCSSHLLWMPDKFRHMPAICCEDREQVRDLGLSCWRHIHTHILAHIHMHTTPLLEETVCHRDCKWWHDKQWHYTTQHTQARRRRVAVRNNPCLGDADHLRCRTPQGTHSHECVWWYGRAWGHEWWLGKWKYQASLEIPIPVCFFHSRLGLLLLALLAQHVACMAPWPQADYEPPSSFCHDQQPR